MSTPTDPIAAMEAELRVQQALLARDLEELGARIAPQAVKKEALNRVAQAGNQAKIAAMDAKDRAVDALLEAKERAGDVLSSAFKGEGECPLRHPGQAASRFLEQARAGEPRALIVATGAAAALAVVSVVALRKAWR